MKRKIYYFILSMGLIAGLTGCTGLIDVQPENSTTYTNYFQTRQDAESLLTELLLRMRNGESARKGLGYILDEDSRYTSLRTMQSGTGDAASVYRLTYQANLILENAHRFKISEEELKPYLLQAYFANALGYWRLARDCGEMVISKSTTDFGPRAKSSVTEMLDEAEKWALLAMDLPKYEELSGLDGPIIKNYGSKGAAAALLAHLYAWRASVEGKDEYWEKAEEYCSMIIEQKVGNYELAADPEAVVTDVMYRDSKESIWEIANSAQEERFMQNTFIGFPVITSGFTPESGYYASTVYKSTVNKMYEEGDKRREAYFFALDADVIYLKYDNGNVIPVTECNPGDSILPPGGYDNTKIKRAFIYKFRYPYYKITLNNPTPQYRGLDQSEVIWRLGEIYLLRAECRARQGKDNAVDDLNVIRRRAFGNTEHDFPNAADVEKGLANNICLAIFREREKELLQENHRYYDVVRNGYCFFNGKDTYDYVRKELPPAFALLTDRDIEDGALYAEVESIFFTNNNLMRQNLYWNRSKQ